MADGIVKPWQYNVSPEVLGAQGNETGNALTAIANALMSGKAAFDKSKQAAIQQPMENEIMAYDLVRHKQAAKGAPQFTRNTAGVITPQLNAVGEQVYLPENANIYQQPSGQAMEIEKMKLAAAQGINAKKDEAKNLTAESQASRNADLSASRDAMRLSGSTGNPMIDALLKLPAMNAHTYGYTKTILTIKTLIDNGFEKKALAMIKSDYGLNDNEAKKRLIALKKTPKNDMYDAIPKIKPVIGEEEAKKVGQLATGATNVNDLFKQWEKSVSQADMEGYQVPENPNILPSGVDQSDTQDINTLYGGQ